MVTDRRLDRLMTALSGRERAIMALQSYKSGADWNPPYVKLSPYDVAEYNRLIDIMRFANTEVADIILLLGEQVTQAELRFAALKLLRARARERYLVKQYLSECVPEPVTESEAAKRKKVPVAGWQVFPDEDADEVAVLREDRKALERLLSRGGWVELPLDLEDVPLEPETGDDEVRLLGCVVRDDLGSLWVQLRACEDVLATYAQEFNGEDVLIPKMRERADETRARIVALAEDFRPYAGAWELPEDHSEATARMRELAGMVLRG